MFVCTNIIFFQLQAELQSLAFGQSKKKKNKPKVNGVAEKDRSPSKTLAEEWEEWKQRDDEVKNIINVILNISPPPQYILFSCLYQP